MKLKTAYDIPGFGGGSPSPPPPPPPLPPPPTKADPAVVKSREDEQRRLKCNSADWLAPLRQIKALPWPRRRQPTKPCWVIDMGMGEMMQTLMGDEKPLPKLYLDTDQLSKLGEVGR
jgi:hypothetical protein